MAILGLMFICGIVCCIGGCWYCCRRRRARGTRTRPQPQWLVVPEGVSAGMQITATWPDGRTVAVMLPDGAIAGQRLQVSATGEVESPAEAAERARLARKAARKAQRTRLAVLCPTVATALLLRVYFTEGCGGKDCGANGQCVGGLASAACVCEGNFIGTLCEQQPLNNETVPGN